MRWVFINNEFFREEEAVIGTGDLGLQRGYAAFDYFRTVNYQPLFLEDYLDRFCNSAKAMGIIMPVDKTELRKIIGTLLEKNRISESGIRMIVTGGYAPDSYTPVRGNLIIQQQPLILPDAEKFERGVKIITHPYMRDLPTVKSVNYLMGIWLQQQLKAKGIDDVLYHDQGLISEFPRANLFMVTSGGMLVTPEKNILSGITRKKLLEWAPALLPVETRDIDRNALTAAAEVFMTSTTKRLLPVVEIDGVRIGEGRAGKFSRLLNARFVEMEQKV